MSTAVATKTSSRAVLAKKKRRVFLDVLAKTGVVAEAARACGYTDTSTVQSYRRQDEDFAEAWDHALEAAKHVLEEEVWRRAKDGVLEPVFYKGEVVGYKTNHSDSLAMFLLRKLDPSYRENSRGGDTNINFGIAVLPMTASSEGKWEERALAMHDDQRTITIEAKPVENSMARVQRSD